MEKIEQIDKKFDNKRPKKKGIIITIIAVIAVIIALLLTYFLVFAKPQYIFNRIIDKIFEIESKEYNSIKVDTKMKISAELEDESMQEQIEALNKFSINLGMQADIEQKNEIINFGLEYDKASVIDVKAYYNKDGEIYAYFNEIFDKYIKLDIGEEEQEMLKKVFEEGASEDKKEATEIAIKTLKDELKTGLKENGTFEKQKDTLNINNKEEKVSKATLTLTEKDLIVMLSNMCNNLAKNDKFIECFDESLKDNLQQIADELKTIEANNKNNIKISVYTKGLLNKVIGVDIEINSVEQKGKIILTILKDNDNIYEYNVKMKSDEINANLISGEVEIEKEKDNKEEKEGNIKITTKIIEIGQIKVNVNYLVKYNKEIDKIDTKNSINMTDLTEEDMQSMMEKLMQRPLIGDILNQMLNTTETNNSYSNNEEITTSENQVKGYEHLVTYSIPDGFEYDKDYSYDNIKFYTMDNSNSRIDATISVNWSSEKEYKEDIEWDYNYYTDNEYYTNTKLEEEKTIKVGEKEFKYKVLTYESNNEYYNEKYENAYVYYEIDGEYTFVIELEARNGTISEDIIKGFLNIQIQEVE